MELKIVTDTIYNQLIVAVNQYISTGDLVGEGMILPENEGDHLRLVIPWNEKDPIDTNDHSLLSLRVQEIRDQLGPFVELKPGEDEWKKDNFSFSILRFRKQDSQKLTDALMAAPSARGWGSGVSQVERFILQGIRRQGARNSTP